MNITILGSTGTIGQKAVEICSRLGFSVVGLACNSQIDILLRQVEMVKPQYVAIADERAAERFRAKLANFQQRPAILAGDEAAVELAALPCDRVVAAMVGFVGLLPVLRAIEAGNSIALANKETLIAAGDLVLPLAEKKGVEILPVDSEHSAIFQCLNHHHKNKIKKILLTASGGPFRQLAYRDLERVTVEDALAHPTWSMGAKITIDSATMMNKGLELIEACHLFKVHPEQVQIVIHPGSIMHSAVEFADGAVIAQMGVPDMYLPIQLALTWPERRDIPVDSLDIFAHKLEFYPPDYDKFPALRLATEAIKIGGTMPCIMNAANEIAVQAFLDRQIGFLNITAIIEKVMQRLSAKVIRAGAELEDVITADSVARQEALNLVKQLN